MCFVVCVIHLLFRNILYKCRIEGLLKEINKFDSTYVYLVRLEMEKYTKVKNHFEENNCKLLTTFEEFEERRQSVYNKSWNYVRVDFIGICGHESNVAVTNFFVRKTGIKCKECVNKNTSNLNKNRNENYCSSCEADGMDIFTKYISEYYDIVRTNEGCIADIAIRKKGNMQDEWVPIQLKTTKQICHNMYSFRGIKGHYKDMLIVCICTSEEKIWVIPYNDVNIKTNINVSKICVECHLTCATCFHSSNYSCTSCTDGDFYLS